MLNFPGVAHAAPGFAFPVVKNRKMPLPNAGKIRYNIRYTACRSIRCRRDDNMAKLYFKYGAMGSSKTATALITKYNYEERGMEVWLIKPSADSRDGAMTLRSRIGLTAECEQIGPDCDIRARYAARGKADVIIVDECQFMTAAQIDQLRELVDRENLPVLCFGLRTDFQTKLFPGSRRLFELADSITEIKTICDCGRKATTNARISPDGYVVTEGDQVFIGGNDSYIAMCHKCYQDYINEHRKVELLHGTERDPQ